MDGITLLFYFLATVAMISAAGVITFRNPIYCVLCLVVTLFSLAGLFILLGAAFLAVIQILTYAGAILVLFIFIIMLLNLKPDELEERGYPPMGNVLLGLIGLVCFLALGYAFRSPPLTVKKLPEDFGSVLSVGRELFTLYVVPFEIAGILLTVALVGAVLLAKRRLEMK